MVRIAIDGMGGDHAPAAVIKGIQLFLEKKGCDTEIVCACPEEKFRQVMDHDISSLKLTACDSYIPMDSKLSLSVFRNKNTTMHRIIQMLKNRDVDVAFSAGNTALFVSIAISELGLIEGIDRPAICVHLPNLKERVTLFLDVGANVSAKPINLLQYAIMGSLYARDVVGIENPSVGLLNIGGEPGKGDELRQSAYKKLSECSAVNFVGNIEGHEMFSGKADVIIADGFSGNIVLKVSEGIGRAFKNIMLREINKSISGKIGLFIARKSIVSYARKTDYAEYGGGVLLGVQGILVIGHGRSSPRAICNALQLGEKIVRSEFIKKLTEYKGKWAQI
ncbi:MAG: phosphate acyltransferase PlsX [Candidatus Omnitrophica bacterium]|nr:phosphate acyltransferase PlsX [Candidatus Omnitrophota bacterium]MCM8828376.1 phosphate acyltransferase PlsX [Candidatus Omnitrophota bacterium]